MTEADSEKYPSLPSNYVSIAQLQERWLKEKQRKQQEKEENKQNLVRQNRQNHQNRIANGSIHSQAPVGKNLHKRENQSAKGWREVGLLAKEPKSKEVKTTAPAVEEGVGIGEKQKKKKGYFGKRKPRVERDGSVDMAKVSTIDVAEEEIMTVVSVENCGRESSKGKCQWNSENKEVKEVATVCMVEVVGKSNVDREIAGQRCKVGFRGKKNSRRMGVWVGKLSHKVDTVEQSGQEPNVEKEEVTVDVKERTNEKVRVRGAFRAFGDKSKDVPLIDSEAGLKMKIERDLGDLSLSDRRYSHGRLSVGMYGDKWRYGSSKRYEPRKMLKQSDNSFVWVKKGESSNGNVAEIENSG